MTHYCWLIGQFGQIGQFASHDKVRCLDLTHEISLHVFQTSTLARNFGFVWIIYNSTRIIYAVSLMSKIGEYLELSEDQTSERHQELLAEFERRKKVNTQH